MPTKSQQARAQQAPTKSTAARRTSATKKSKSAEVAFTKPGVSDKKLTIVVDGEVLARFKSATAADGVSMAEVIRESIDAYLKRHDGRKA